MFPTYTAYDSRNDINCDRGCKCKTALHSACEYARTRWVHQLLTSGADCKVQDHFGRSSLHWACTSGHAKTVSMILHAGADVNQCDGRGHNAICYSKGYPVVKQLVFWGMALTREDLVDNRVFRAQKALKRKQLETLALLKEIQFLTPNIIEYELLPLLNLV